jgi:hypothetical protein
MKNFGINVYFHENASRAGPFAHSPCRSSLSRTSIAKIRAALPASAAPLFRHISFSAVTRTPLSELQNCNPAERLWLSGNCILFQQLKKGF